MHPRNELSISQVFIGSEIRLHRDGSGRVRTYHNAATFERWRPYRDGLGAVNVVARVDRSEISESGAPVDGPGVNVIAVRHYHGLRELILNVFVVGWQVLRLGDRQSLFIGRLPELISMLLFLRSRLVGARFVSLVASEPRQLFRALFPGLLGRFVGWFAATLTRLTVKSSVAVIYVTQRWLQSLYPARAGIPTLARSNVALPHDAILGSSRIPVNEPHRETVLVTVATLENRHKGIDCLLDVVAMVRSRGVGVSLVIVGSGQLAPQLVRQTEELGLERQVRFTGHLDTAEAVRDQLDCADVFVLTSRVEGLPRAVIEAMARGLPVIATRAGGVEELLSEDFICPIDDVGAIANRIISLVGSPERMASESRRNLSTACIIAESSSDNRLIDFLSLLGGRGERDENQAV